MRWVRKTVLFFVVVGFMTLVQICITIVQTNFMIRHEKDLLDDYIPVQAEATVMPQKKLLASPLYDCDEEYNTLLDLPPSLKAANCSDCSEFTCKAFLFQSSNKSLFAKARTYMKNHPKVSIADKYYANIAKDCDDFQKRRGYHTKSVNAEEEEYPLAFNMLIHKDLEHVEKLLRAIYRPQNVYCIHVDAKSPQSLMNGIRAIADCFDNVFIATKLEHIVYAGFTRLQADINCMQDLVQSPVQWKYLLNLAGQSYPLMTNTEMVKVAKIYNGMNDVEGITRRVLHGRIDNEWIELNGKTMNKTGRKNPKPPYDIDIVRGSAYGVFSREFVEFILTDKKANDLLKWSRTTYSPDEHYWATLHHTWSNPHLHTPGGYSGYPDSKSWLAVYVAWGGRDKCEGMWKRGVCIFGVGDLPRLLHQREFFSNKFYLDYQPMALECMESWIEYKTRCPVPFDENYYKNLPFVKNKWKFW